MRLYAQNVRKNFLRPEKLKVIMKDEIEEIKKEPLEDYSKGSFLVERVGLEPTHFGL